ncbi:MAG: type IX secretion system sortase PorU [Bacteroidota bacterium]
MNYFKTLFFSLLIGPGFLSKIAVAQNNSVSLQLNWGKIEKKAFTENYSISYINCLEADYNFTKHNLPIVVKSISTNGNVDSKSITLSDEKYIELNPEQSAVVEKHKDLISDKINIQSFYSSNKKTSNTIVEFIPFRKNTSGKIEKLISAKINYTDNNNAQNKSKKSIQNYAQNSVLKSGNWHRLGVWEDAVYKVDYTMLKFMGVDVDNIDPRNIRVYGNGTGILSEQNSQAKPDDLLENKILVFGETDGKFNKEDYIVFFGKGPHQWKINSSKEFYHEQNIYSDTSYYFLTFDLGAGKRIEHKNNNSLVPTETSSSYDYLVFHEKDIENIVKSGKEWYGEKFENQTAYAFNVSIPNAVLNSNSLLKASVAARSTPASNFSINCQGNTLTLTPYEIGLEYWQDPASETFGKLNFISNSTDYSINAIFNKNPNFSTATGWLNYFEIITRANIDASLLNFSFRDLQSVGANKKTQFTVANFNSSTQFLLDVTQPYNASIIDLNGTSFVSETDSLKEFFVFTNDKNNLKRPVFIERVTNQNLHGLPTADMVIIAHPNFYSEAQRLAQLHQQYDGYTIHLVTPQQIYNEFSSGSQDITAIKYFMKMFYDRATNTSNYPKHLLLFGDASYNYKSKINNTNFIPSYQSQNATSFIDSYVSDDYFGLLDDNEGNGLGDGVDVAIGRLPVKTMPEAKIVVDKLYSYVERKTNTTTNNKQSLSAGDWKNVVCFVGDDQDGGLHLRDADKLAVYIDTNFREINVDKIYFDSYKQESSSGGQRYPEVKSALNNRVNKGALIVNYTGHGGETGWGHERILEVGDINSWQNEEKLPLFVTATCEFSRFDDPNRTSAGEDVLLKANGGGIGLLTTTRLVFSSPNFVLNQNFYKNVFVKQNNEIKTIGETFRVTKNLSANSFSTNHRNFSLLGDPAIKLHYPKNKIVTTSINGITIQAITDTLKALSKVSVTGIVTNENGIKLSNFNGIIYPTVLDKSAELSTMANDPDSPKIKYNLQQNAVYRGKISVANGEFSFSFIVPKDISYNFGKGRISYFAEGETDDANGYNENFIIGGLNNNAPIDETGPEIKLYMNDDKFVSGSVTNEEPLLLAYVKDENGVNTVGAGIGHDIIAILDNNTEKSIVLNDFYQADLNTYQSGKVIYPFSKLDEGKHSIDFKIWDVYNNSEKSSIDFVVAKSAEVALSHVLNYPNPFTTKTKFFFEHNQPFTELNVSIQIFTVSGKVIKTIDQTILTNGFRSDEMEWDGKDDFGDKIGRGVYIYKIKVISPDGKSAEQYEKLVLLN